jgi:hypothetical protein
MKAKLKIKKSELQEMISEAVLKENSEPEVDLATALEAFKRGSRNIFGLTRFKFNNKGEAKIPDLNGEFGLFGQLLKSAHIYVADKGTNRQNESYYRFNLTYGFKGGGSNGNEIGMVFINNDDPEDIKVRLTDGTVRNG